MSKPHSSKGALQTSLGKVRGLGSAKDGTHHWWMQRVTGMALVPLTVFFLYNLDKLIHPNYSEIVINFIAHPGVTVALAAFIICAYYHAYLGIQVIVEDYVHSHGCKTAMLLANKFFFAALGLTSLYLLVLIASPNAEWAMRNAT